MARHSAVVFFLVSLVAIAGLSVFLDSQPTGRVVTFKDCDRYTNQLDLVFGDTISRAQGKKGYSSAPEIRINPCTGIAEPGILQLYVQSRPLFSYGYFEWDSGSVYAFQGSPNSGKGNIQYWFCPNSDRARVIMYDIEVCNTFDNTFNFEDFVMPRSDLLSI